MIRLAFVLLVVFVVVRDHVHVYCLVIVYPVVQYECFVSGRRGESSWSQFDVAELFCVPWPGGLAVAVFFADLSFSEDYCVPIVFVVFALYLLSFRL